jgi:hypothetical protein
MKLFPKNYEKKLDKIYMSKSLTNRLCLKRELYQLRMEEGTDIRDHLNVFNRLTTQLSSVETKIEEEDHALLLLSSLPSSYGTNEILKLEKVTKILSETEKVKKPMNNSDAGAFVVKSDSIVVGMGRMRRIMGRSQDQNLDQGRILMM